MKTPNYNLEKLHEYAIEGLASIEATVRDQDIVVMLGNSNAGKSTLLANMLGHELKPRIYNGRRVLDYTNKNPTVTRPVIGHNFDSETLHPEGYKSTGGSCYVDFPGFQETRSEEHRIITNVTTELAIKAARSIRSVCVVIDYNELAEGNAQGLIKLTQTLATIFHDPKLAQNSVLFMFNKVPAGITKANIMETVEALQAQLTRKSKAVSQRLETMVGSPMHFLADAITGDDVMLAQMSALSKQMNFLNLLVKFQDNVLVVDPADQDKSKRAVLAKLTQLEHIPKEAFSFRESSPSRVQFVSTLISQAGEGERLLLDVKALPRRIAQRERQIDKTLSDIAYYQEMITNFGKASRVDRVISAKQVQIKTHQSTIKNNQKTVLALQASLRDLDGSRAQLLHELASYDRDDSTFYTKLDYVGNDSYWPWRYHATRQLMEYDDKPFVDYETNCARGSFVTPPTHINKAQGKLSILYTANFLQKAKASVSVNVAKRDLPTNHEKILSIRQRIAHVDNEIAVCSDAITALLSQNDVINKTIKSLQGVISVNSSEVKALRAALLESCNNLLPAKLAGLRDSLAQDIAALAAATTALAQALPQLKLIDSLYQELGFSEPVFTQLRGALGQYNASQNQATERERLSDDVSADLVCQLTGDLMTNPVVTKDCQHVFERHAIEQVLSQNNGEMECPGSDCDTPITFESLRTHGPLQKKIQDYLKLSSPVSEGSVDTNSERYSPSTDTTEENDIDAWERVKPDVLSMATYQHTTAAGETLEFMETKMKGNGDCGFLAMGITRAELVESFMAQRDKPAFRAQFVADIKQLLIDHELVTLNSDEATQLLGACEQAQGQLDEKMRDVVTKHPELEGLSATNRIERLQGYEQATLRQSVQALESAEQVLNAYCQQQEIFTRYVEDGLGQSLWASCQALLAYAKLSNSSLTIWNKQPDQALQVLQSWVSPNPSQTHHLVFDYSHFNRLEPQFACMPALVGKSGGQGAFFKAATDATDAQPLNLPAGVVPSLR